MKHRKLRIAWSVAWGVVAVLVCGLWVRSYSRWDELGGEALDNIWIQARSLYGEIVLAGGYSPNTPLIPLSWSTHKNLEVRDHWVTADGGSIGTSLERRGKFGFYFILGNNNLHAFFPHWFPAVLMLAVATAPWWRFGLRTLLIVMALVSMGLGMVVWMSRGG